MSTLGWVPQETVSEMEICMLRYTGLFLGTQPVGNLGRRTGRGMLICDAVAA